MNLIERFRYIMKLNNLTASAFADEINVQRSSVSHILSGRNKPSLEFIQKVITKYPKVDAAWLINGTTPVSTAVNSKDQLNLNVSEENQDVAGLLVKQPEEKLNEKKLKDKSVERIVLFYSDNTFEEFKS